MDQRLSFVTLAVDDLDDVRRFYLDGLGWEASHDSDEVLMLRAGPMLVLSWWRRDAFEAEVGPIGTGPAPVTLAHNVATREGVDRVLAEGRAAGASLPHPPAERIWGGYTGYFTDPAGYRWEVAWNPGPIGQEVLP